MSRNTFRTKYWLPAVEASELGFAVRMHDLRHAHASWLLAGGADLKTVMNRLGHSQIQTTQKYLHTLPDANEQALQALTGSSRGAGGLMTPLRPCARPVWCAAASSDSTGDCRGSNSLPGAPR